MHRHAWKRRRRQGNRERALAINLLHHFSPSVAYSAMGGRIGGETRRRDQGLEVGVRGGLIVAVIASIVNRGFRPPEVVQVLVVKGSNRRVTDSHVDERKVARVLG